ncbi:MAG: hypothetical protein ACYTBS_25215 [Planctomycetota bacterium]|jgi:hypothetical protein
METKERTNDEKKASQTWADMSCCKSNADPWPMASCCKSFFETHDCSSMMDRCVTMCRWFPLLPLILGIALLLLGYYLDASITRILWMFVAGFVALMGTFGLILAGRMKKMCRGME